MVISKKETIFLFNNKYVGFDNDLVDSILLDLN